MIEVKEKMNCSGCTACKSVCPKKCIEMKPDSEGFLYPEIEKQKCINCHLCEKICPILNKEEEKKQLEEPEAYAIYHKDENIRKESTSGGFFSAVAEKILEKNGVVFGAAFNQELEVIHTYIEKKEELSKFRGSKYVQSQIKNSYIEVKEFLEQGRYVLFSGTPCQVYGLKSFLGKEYERLYCLDVICKGVPSPKLWKKYLEQKQKKGNVKTINFREKTYGYSSTTMSLYYENGKTYHKGHESDSFLKLFVGEICSRPSCYACSFKTKRRVSDFTIGDCWKVEKMVPEMQDDQGVTLVILHSKKGKECLEEIKNTVNYKAINIDEALKLNGGNKSSMYLSSAKPSDKREHFYKDLDKIKFKKVIQKYANQTLKSRIKGTLKPILYRVGVLKKLKETMRK